MTAISDTPANKNFLSPLNFTFFIKKSPGVNYFIQKINVPSITLPSPDQPNPFVSIPRPGDHIAFGDLKLSFKVDEDLQNYMEIYNWLIQMGKPRDFDQYLSIQNQTPTSGLGIYSDIEISILTSKKQPNYVIVFEDAFPVYLSEIEFDTTMSDVQFITAEATFKYKLYNIEAI